MIAPAAALAGILFGAVLFTLARRGARAAGEDAGRFSPALAAGAALAAALACARGIDGDALGVAVAFVAAVVAGIVDRRTGLIPDLLVFPALAAILALRLPHWPDALAGAAVTAGVLALPYAATLGRGFGLGDVKFGFVAGAALGPLAGATAVGAAFVLGGLVATILLLCRRARRGAELPFGPYVALGTFVAWAAARSGAVAWLR